MSEKKSIVSGFQSDDIHNKHNQLNMQNLNRKQRAPTTNFKTEREPTSREHKRVKVCIKTTILLMLTSSAIALMN